jgi:hypothetical protein
MRIDGGNDAQQAPVARRRLERTWTALGLNLTERTSSEEKKWFAGSANHSQAVMAQ